MFRFEEAPATIRPGQSYRLSDADLASRLSFFLWGTVPDAELLKHVSDRTLRAPGVLDKQVKRMLASPKSEALATRFAAQWLRLQDVDKVSPDYLQYPQYDDRLATAFKRETELFFDSLVRDDRSLLDLLTADYSFVNERVALHYGIPNVTGSHFRRVTLPENRRGILGHGSVLVLTSNSDRTSPVYRGKWVMEVLLGSPPPPPPPNVPELDEVKPTGGGTDAFGSRADGGAPEEPDVQLVPPRHRSAGPGARKLRSHRRLAHQGQRSGRRPGGHALRRHDDRRPGEPAAALLKYKDAVVLSFTESLMTYALGRRVEHYDMPAIRGIVRDAAKNDYRMSSFINGMIRSAAFQMGRVPTENTRVADPVAR